MRNGCRFLWLNGIFDESTVEAYPSLSPAANFWQRGFAGALKKMGHEIEIIGHPVERVWPFGRLIISGEKASIAHGLKGRTIGYVNAPIIRRIVQFLNYLKMAKSLLRDRTTETDYILTYSCLTRQEEKDPPKEAAKYIRKHFGIPWICIVADGVPPPGADGYVFLAWSSYKSFKTSGSSIHIDGGLPEIQSGNDSIQARENCRRAKIVMYMGALTRHAGSIWLARAFYLLPDKDIRLWICGRGGNRELEQLSEIDGRIKVLGFVSERELNDRAHAATAFVNPRPGSFEPNKLNYPSKVLHYLAYGKPVVSTFTEGLSPEYKEILINIPEENELSLKKALQDVLNMEQREYDDLCLRIKRFNESHSWKRQADRFTSWLNSRSIPENPVNS